MKMMARPRIQCNARDRLPQLVVVFETMTDPSNRFAAGKATTLPGEQDIQDANPSRICLESFQIVAAASKRSAKTTRS
jgi:hypothetical protein